MLFLQNFDSIRDFLMGSLRIKTQNLMYFRSLSLEEEKEKEEEDIVINICPATKPENCKTL